MAAQYDPELWNKEDAAIDALIKEAAKRKKALYFTDPARHKDTEALAMIVSKFCDWSGDSIISVAVDALIDANYDKPANDIRHEYAASVERMSNPNL